MLKAPFVYILVNPKQGDQFDITDMVTNFVYEESIEKDNMVEFDIVSNYVQLMSENEDLDKGAEILFTFGYSNGSKSEQHRALITDVEHIFSNLNINMKVRALDKGSVLKNTSSPQTYENATSTDIAKLIATRHNLQFRVDNTEKVWDSIPQGNLDDLSFLRKLAGQEKAGNYITYIKDDTLYFVRRGLDTPSLVTYTYGEGNNGIINFAPKWRESTADPSGHGATGIGFDPNKKEFNVSKETAESENEVISTGDYHLIYSSEGEHVANGTDNKSFDVQDFVTKNVKNGTEDLKTGGFDEIIQTGKQFVSGTHGTDLSDRVSGSKKANTQKVLEASLQLVGNPLLKVNALITMANVTKRYNGNWYVITCRHTISGSSFITDLTMNRNGSKKATKGKTTSKASQVNSTTGDTNGVNDDIIILQFNSEGERTADITKAGRYVPPQKI